MKKEFKSQLQELLNSSNTTKSPIYQYKHISKSPYNEYSLQSTNNSNKSTSIFGLNYTSPLRTFPKKQETEINNTDFFRDLQKQYFKHKEHDNNSSTSRNTLFDKSNTTNKYTYEDLKQIHQISKKPSNNDIFNLNDSNLNKTHKSSKSRVLIKNTPSSIKRKIALFADNFNLNNNNRNISESKKRDVIINPTSLKFDLDINKSNRMSSGGNCIQGIKYGSFLNNEINCFNSDKKSKNRWDKDIQYKEGNRDYKKMEGNDGRKNLEKLVFKKDNKSYKFKGDKRMEAFMKEFDIDSTALRYITKKYNKKYAS